LNGKKGAPAWWRGLAPASPYSKPPRRATDATRCRRIAAEALRRIGPAAAEAVPALNAALRDADTDVRHAAATALKKIRIRSASA
jgi:HEAT repeat protein